MQTKPRSLALLLFGLMLLAVSATIGALYLMPGEATAAGRPCGPPVLHDCRKIKTPAQTATPTSTAVPTSTPTPGPSITPTATGTPTEANNPSPTPTPPCQGVLTAEAVQGTKQLQVSNDACVAGEYILITPGEVHEEIVGIAGSSGSTVDLTDALLFNHTTGDPYVMTTTAPTSTPTP